VPFRKIVTPVIEQLQNRFPKLFLLDQLPKEGANDIAEAATDAFGKDTQLRQMLINGFEQLKAGQVEIL